LSTSEIIASISAAIAAGSLLIVILQFIESRRRVRTEAERLSEQRERLKTALSGAVSGANISDLIIQRSKEADATVQELQNIARALRQNLMLLAQQLDADDKRLTSWAEDLSKSQRRVISRKSRSR
jgi:hypothetical protein